MDNLNVLVEAKKEYLGQMCLIMCPPMIEVFQDMYIEAMKTSKGKQVLIMFQKHLKSSKNNFSSISYFLFPVSLSTIVLVPIAL